MASMKTLSRLHAVAPQEPVKSPTVGHSPPDVAAEPDLLALQTAEWQRPARGFVSPRSSRLDGPVLMGAMRSSVPGDRGGAFADLAARDAAAVAVREAVARQIARQAGRGGADAQPLPLAIQI